RRGSDAQWAGILENRGIKVNAFIPANCGITIPWSAHFAERFTGTPLKRIAATSGVNTGRGEVVITRRGLEGGAVYALNRELRQSKKLTLDLRPDLTHAT